MNIKSKFVFPIGLAGLLCLMLAGSVQAETQYAYSGQPLGPDPPYSYPYTPSDSVQGSFTVDTALADNLPLTDITAQVESFSYTDGIYTYASDGSFSSEDFQAATNGAGTITAWEVLLYTGGAGVLSCYDDPDAACVGPGWGFPGEGDEAFAGGVGLHENFDPATGALTLGTWAAPATVPEPATLFLFGTGLLGVAIAARKRSQSPRTAARRPRRVAARQHGDFTEP